MTQEGLRYNKDKWQCHKLSPKDLSLELNTHPRIEMNHNIILSVEQWRMKSRLDWESLHGIYHYTFSLIKSKEDRLGYNKIKGSPYLLPSDVLMAKGINNFYSALYEVSQVYTFGKEKYSERNWEKGLKWDEGVMSSYVRHFKAYLEGEDLDKESGLPHVLHMGFNILALLTFELRGIGEDDRKEW